MRFYTNSHRCMAFAKVASSIKGFALLFILHSTTNSKTFNKMALAIVLSLSLVLVHYASGHARLLQPPSRSSMWRLGFDNPADYSDNQGFCGGIKVSSNYSISTNFELKSRKKPIGFKSNQKLNTVFIYFSVSIWSNGRKVWNLWRCL